MTSCLLVQATGSNNSKTSKFVVPANMSKGRQRVTS